MLAADPLLSSRPSARPAPCFPLRSRLVTLRKHFSAGVLSLWTNPAVKCTCCQKSLPPHLAAARATKRAGLIASSSIALAAVTAGNVLEVPNLRWAIAGLLAFFGVVFGFSTGFGGLFRAQVHNGRLYVQWGDEVPDDGPPLLAGAVEVRSTGDTRGNGAFAAHNISAGTWLGDYEGELLDEAQYWARYPSGMSDYAICIDEEWTLDARDRVQDISTFSPCHINHSSERNNVMRKPFRDQQTIKFFAKRDIEAGEELLLDYGRMYWKGREDQELS